MSAMLEIRNLTKSFPTHSTFGRQTGEVKAVADVSFAIEKGQVYGLAGESGSGKSTIARMIMGLTRPTSGAILIDGQDIAGQIGTRAHGRRVQMVFQNPGASLNPRRTVAQSISVPLVAHGFDRAAQPRRIGELLDMVQLPQAFAQRYPHELSGGQKQRVAIARALDLTFLFISHDLSLMRNFAQRVGILYLGQIVETGLTAEVFERPTHDYTRLLLASVPVISAEEEAMRPIIPLIDGEIPTAEKLLALRGQATGKDTP